MAKTAFVTGGSGFIGGRLIGRLLRDGWRVRALARSNSSAAAVEALGAETAPGDLESSGMIAAGAEGADVAFHLAAHVADWGPLADFERVNVVGTRNVIDACQQAGVPRLVHCGTEAALMAGEPLVGVDETAPLRPDSPAPYSSTKAKAEQAVVEANRDGFETVVLRPRFVWGSGDTTLLPGILEMVEKGRFAWVDGGKNLTETTHVDNVVEGLVLAAERGRGGEAYFVTDGDPVAFREFVSEMLETQGVEPPSRELPAWLSGAVSRIGESAYRVLPFLPGRPPVTRFSHWVVTQECTIAISKARSELGYAPIVTREQGLEEMRAASTVAG